MCSLFSVAMTLRGTEIETIRKHHYCPKPLTRWEVPVKGLGVTALPLGALCITVCARRFYAALRVGGPFFLVARLTVRTVLATAVGELAKREATTADRARLQAWAVHGAASMCYFAGNRSLMPALF